VNDYDLRIVFILLLVIGLPIWLLRNRPWTKVRISPRLGNHHKQLVTLLVATAAWVVVALFLSLPYTYNFGAFVARPITFSSPALLFGGIILWWLRRQ